MTENKRFIINDGIVTDKIDLSMYMDNEDCCEKLNELHEDVERQREFKFSAIRQANRIDKENEQLKQRNDRQAKQLDNLYNLIEKQDWKTLKGLIQEFQECEEQLQKEWSEIE